MKTIDSEALAAVTGGASAKKAMLDELITKFGGTGAISFSGRPETTHGAGGTTMSGAFTSKGWFGGEVKRSFNGTVGADGWVNGLKTRMLGSK